MIITLTILMSSMFYSTAQYDFQLKNEVNIYQNSNIDDSNNPFMDY